ncbi:MAG: carbon starvation protein A [Porcipelethomonas sp.]
MTFIAWLVLLIGGGAIYGRISEKMFCPDDRQTPAVSMNDGVDYIPMKKWKNCLIQLLNIAGTGPVLGPIQGILFGPVAFITIPVGCVIAGAFHDYMCGMISVRNNGQQTPKLIRSFLGKHAYAFYSVFVCILLMLLGTVFTYTPGDVFVSHILHMESGITNPVLWIVYGIIFAYFILASVLPIDKIIGKVYPILGGVLLLSSVGIIVGIFIKGYPLDEIWNIGISGVHPKGLNFIPIFFVTVACGIISGFHSTQSTLVSRTIENEKHGRGVFYNMMIAEGFIAMTWAAATMGVINMGLANADTPATDVVGIVAESLLGKVGGTIAVIGIIILPITSGDTAFRSLRLIISEAVHINKKSRLQKGAVSAAVFGIAAALLVFSKSNPDGFSFLWRYSAWANQVITVFTLSMISVFMIKSKKPFLMALIPGMFYMFVILSFILNAKIGFNMNWTASYTIAGILTAVYSAAVIICGRKYLKSNITL